MSHLLRAKFKTAEPFFTIIIVVILSFERFVDSIIVSQNERVISEKNKTSHRISPRTGVIFFGHFADSSSLSARDFRINS